VLKNTKLKMKKTMKKTILAVATAIISTFAMTTMANDGNQDNSIAKEYTARRCHDCVLDNKAFDGIELTDTQKTEIENTRTRRAEQAKVNREKARADRKEAKKQAREERRRQRSDMRDQARKERREALTEIKAILTPEQYIEYLENIVVNNTARPRTLMHGARLGRADKEIHIRDNRARKIQETHTMTADTADK